MTKDIREKIKHVVVLMLENRSTDHILGDFPGVDGINNASYNLLCATSAPSPSNPEFKPYSLDVNTQSLKFNPDHSFPGMMTDFFGFQGTAGSPDDPIQETQGYLSGTGPIGAPPPPLYPERNSGFLHDPQTDGNPPDPITSYFAYYPPGSGNPGRLKVLHLLAEQFCVCDQWHCDVPASTTPNRIFMHAATTQGYLGFANPGQQPFYCKTIFEQLSSFNKDWAMYYYAPQDNCDSVFFPNIANEERAQKPIGEFAVDVAAGKLPFYTFLMPSLGGYQSDPDTAGAGNSMHPPGDIRWGENYIAEIYNCLRNSPSWENTLFIITFDENGGIYDHVTPRQTVQPDQYDYVSNGENLFDFTLLGPRVPALLISPWLDPEIFPGSGFPIIRPPYPKYYQNTSILRFVQDLIAPPGTAYLTERDRHANSFAHLFRRETPRTDCPTAIEGYGTQFNWPVGYVFDATNTSPIVITTEAIAGLPPQSIIPPKGTEVIVSGVNGNTAANGTWIITPIIDPVSGASSFSLDGSSGNGSYQTGGEIIGATNASPIVITTNIPSPATGTSVRVSRVEGNTAANGTWIITAADTPDSFSLNGSVGNGEYIGGGKWTSGSWTWPGQSMGDDQPPTPYALDLAKEYFALLPGHPDSGKPITQDFPTRAALGKYSQQRREAALAHYARAKETPKP
jgi:phospholipase C